MRWNKNQAQTLRFTLNVVLKSLYGSLQSLETLYLKSQDLRDTRQMPTNLHPKTNLGNWFLFCLSLLFLQMASLKLPQSICTLNLLACFSIWVQLFEPHQDALLLLVLAYSIVSTPKSFFVSFQFFSMISFVFFLKHLLWQSIVFLGHCSVNIIKYFSIGWEFKK